MKKNRQNYEAPALTVVEFRIERGFAASSLMLSSSQRINSFVDENLTIVMGQQNANQEPIGAGMNGNIDMTNPGGSSAWQYSNGGWF